MTYIASGTIPQQALERIDALMLQVKQATTQIRSDSNSGLDPRKATAYRQRLIRWLNEMNALSGTPGLADHAKQQRNDDTYDVVAEFNATTTEVQAMIDWIFNNFPASSNWQDDGSGNLTLAKIPSGNLDPFRTRASALEATIT